MNSDTSLLVTRRMAAISWSRRLCPRAVDGAKAAIIVGAVVGPVAAVYRTRFLGHTFALRGMA